MTLRKNKLSSRETERGISWHENCVMRQQQTTSSRLTTSATEDMKLNRIKKRSAKAQLKIYRERGFGPLKKFSSRLQALVGVVDSSHGIDVAADISKSVQTLKNLSKYYWVSET